MSLSNVADRLTAEELAREPRNLGVLAWFDGHAFGSGQGKRHAFPRRLTFDEERCWREGFVEGRTERVCHSWHGFIPHDHPENHAQDHPPVPKEPTDA